MIEQENFRKVELKMRNIRVEGGKNFPPVNIVFQETSEGIDMILTAQTAFAHNPFVDHDGKFTKQLEFTGSDVYKLAEGVKIKYYMEKRSEIDTAIMKVDDPLGASPRIKFFAPTSQEEP